MKIKVNTKSNFKNCNDHLLDVVRAEDNYFDAKVPEYGFDVIGRPSGKMVTATFSLKEVVGVEYTKT